MLRTFRPPAPRYLLLSFTLSSALLSTLIIINDATDSALALLVWPILYAAFAYRQRVYLAMLGIGALAESGVRVATSSTQPALISNVVLLAVIFASTIALTHHLVSRWRSTQSALHARTASYRSLVDQSLTALYRVNQEGTLCEGNPALAHLLGYSACAEMLGQHVAALYHDPDEWRQCSALVLTHGRVVDREVQVRRRDGTLIWALKSAICEYDEAGAPAAIVGTLVDITARKRAEEVQRFLSEASALLNSSLDYEHTLHSLASMVTTVLGDWCTVTVVQQSDVARHNLTVCAIPDKQPLVVALAPYRLRADAPYNVPYVLRTGQAELLPDVPADYLQQLACDERHLELLQQLDLHSVITVPLRARGQTIGAIVLATLTAGRRYGPDDLALAEELARHAATAIDNARLHHATQRRLAEMTTVQRIARVVNSSLQLNDLFQIVVAQISAAFGYRMISIYLRERDGLALQAQLGYPDRLPFIRLDQGVCGRVTRTGQLAFVRDVRQDPDFIVVVPDTQQIITVPFKGSDEQVLGVLMVESNGTPLLTEDDVALLTLLADQVSVAVANVRLFADLQASEQRYRTSEERYRLLAENSLDLIELLDLQGTVLYVSPAHAQVLGYAPAEIIHTSIVRLIHPEDTPRMSSAMQALLASGASSTVELRLRRKDGGWLSVEALLSAITDSAGAARLLFSARDMTERQRAEQERLVFERKLLETQKLESLGVLAGGIAHDFNNLLTAILGHTELALLDVAPQTAAYQSIAAVERITHRAADLIRQLLAYAGKGSFIVAPIDLNRLVQEMAELFKTSVAKVAILHYALAPDLPQINADITQIRQVLMNLVINAAEALGDNTGTIMLRTGVRRLTRASLAAAAPTADLAEDTYVFCEVTDTGIGMNAETQARIFEPFFTTKFTGRGLGLAAVQGIVRAHGGALLVASASGQGTTFTMLLPSYRTAAPPKSAAHLPTPAAPPAHVAHAAPAPDAPRQTVLVVDDEPGVRAVTVKILARCGYDVLEAADGALGVAALRAHAATIACVLLDLTMPNMSGAEALRAMRQIKPDVQVIVMSGYSEQEVSASFCDMPLAGFLQKPFSSAALRDKLHAAVLAPR